MAAKKFYVKNAFMTHGAPKGMRVEGAKDLPALVQPGSVVFIEDDKLIERLTSKLCIEKWTERKHGVDPDEEKEEQEEDAPPVVEKSANKKQSAPIGGADYKPGDGLEDEKKKEPGEQSSQIVTD